MKRRDNNKGWDTILLGVLLILFGLPQLAFAAPKSEARVLAWVYSSNAAEFFTNMSSRLLAASGYPFDSAHIPVWTNGTFAFSPDVHRILQVSANIYDASTNREDRGGPEYPFLPSVFRPVFRVESSNVFISGWVEETGGTNWAFQPRDLNDPADRAALQPNDNVYDVPWIVGAKKGFPSFNEFAMQSVASVTRRLQIRKALPGGPPISTNQMFLVGISNAIAVELWNPYPSSFSRAVEIRVLNDMNATFCFTNDAQFDLRGGRSTLHFTASSVTNLGAGSWSGYGRTIREPSSASFLVPLTQEAVLLPYSVCRANPGPGGTPYFTLSTNHSPNSYFGYEQNLGFYIPQFGLSISNRLRVVMLDHNTQRVIDHVCISGLQGKRDLSAELGLDGGVSIEIPSISGTLFWQTHRISQNVHSPTIGVLNQLLTSLGVINVPDWNSFGINQAAGNTQRKQIDQFRTFMGLAPIYFPNVGNNTNAVMEAPFTPTHRTSQSLTWQANDPFVHFLRQDLENSRVSDVFRRELPSGPVQMLRNIGKLNDRYEPWGGFPGSATSSGTVPPYGSAYKDPLVFSASDWNFGNQGSLAFDWLGKVHRGTPWQTLYLKSAGVDPATWQNWLGGWDADSAKRAEPLNDRLLLDSLLRLLNTKNPNTLLSVNELNPNRWRKVLNGVEVQTNTAPIADLLSYPPRTQFKTNTMHAGDKQAMAIAEAIGQTRGSKVWQEVSDVLATPELAENSPWLDLSSAMQLQRGISDEAYEAIASQLLPRLRADSKGAARPSGDGVALEFTGYDGGTYAIETSSDLVHWHHLGESIPTNGVIHFTDSRPSRSDCRFYRSRLLP